MRTVSFSSDPVQETLKTKFVAAVVNTTGSPATGASCKHAPNEQAGMCTPGIGHQNVQCLFLTPEGEIFHAVTGHQSPKALAAELDYAERLFAQMKENPDEARELVVKRHRATLTALGDSENGGLNMMAGMLDGTFRRRKDAQFCVDHPLLSWEALQRRPQLLVGNEKTFFASKSGGVGTH
jgi:hypothetical protein